jgi:GntR family transcriptional regulator
VLNASSPLPLYHQLAEELFAQIRAGTYPPGSRIPSEKELAERYGLGRPTVRQATSALIQRGVLTRRRGSGTYVRSVPVQVDLFSLAGTLVSFRDRGIELEVALLGTPRAEQIEEADHPLDGRMAARLVRLSSLPGTTRGRRRVQGEPVLLEEIDLDAEVFPALIDLDLRGRSLSEVIESRYRMLPQSADQTFCVERLDSAHACNLRLPEGEPVLRVDRTLHFASALAAVFARMYCRTDRFVFSQRIGGDLHA